ncbi:MAG TPA: outer membrane protein assembly factor BamE [Methylocella sp.]|nr:outer membrane protein assembly factor BamE [Methylocella sp.]
MVATSKDKHGFLHASMPEAKNQNHLARRCGAQPAVRYVKLALVAALALSAAGCLGYDGQVIHGYQLDPKAAEQVRPGDSAEHILVLLGTPTTTSTVGGDAWYYVTQVTNRSVQFMQPKVTDQRVFAVYFTKDKKVARVANYGMEDGKLIDFVSRTTPTAGAESTFLKGMFINLLRF